MYIFQNSGWDNKGKVLKGLHTFIILPQTFGLAESYILLYQLSSASKTNSEYQILVKEEKVL